MNRDTDPNNSPRDFEELYCGALAKFFYIFNLYYAHGMMAVYTLFTVTTEGATYATAVDIFNGNKASNDNYGIITHDGFNWRSFVEMLQIVHRF